MISLLDSDPPIMGRVYLDPGPTKCLAEEGPPAPEVRVPSKVPEPVTGLRTSSNPKSQVQRRAKARGAVQVPINGPGESIRLWEGLCKCPWLFSPPWPLEQL